MGHSPLPRPLLGGEGDIPPRTLLPRHLRRLASRAFGARPPHSKILATPLRSALQDAGINTGNAPKLGGSAETPPLEVGGVADSKIHAISPHVLPRQIW